jgi:hypothetical protein
MALSIGVKKGSRVMINHLHEVEVTEILPSNRMRLTYREKTYEVSDVERTQIDTEVFVSSGRGHTPSNSYRRLAFEAPRSIRIERLK